MRRTTALARVAAVLAASTLTACSSTADGSPGHAPSADAAAALAAWKDFPATANPRPVVLLGRPIIDPASGFRTDADKIAYIDGNLIAAATPQMVTMAPAGGRLMSLGQAFDVLVGPRHNAAAGAPSLVVTAGRRAMAAFATDRGMQSLPVWVFTIRGVADPVSVLAIPEAQQWPKPGSASDQVVAVPAGAQNSRQVTVWFVGGAAGTGPCTSTYTAAVAESATAVVVTPIEHPSPGQAGVVCAAVGYRRSVTVTLSSPLGGRVLLTPNAWSGPVS